MEQLDMVNQSENVANLIASTKAFIELDYAEVSETDQMKMVALTLAALATSAASGPADNQRHAIKFIIKQCKIGASLRSEAP